jgi:hypothetical protein
MFKNDLKGQRFGRLVAIEFCGNNKHGCSMWLCKCDCGNIKQYNSAYLRSGDTKSCGCYLKDKVSGMFSTHRMSKTKIYETWAHMKQRCYDPNQDRYEHYGGRGIKVCEKWQVFEGFYEDMGATHKPGLSLERKDVNGDYCPENCEWIPLQLQAQNKTNSIILEVNNVRGDLAELCRIFDVKYNTVYMRMRRGWTPEEAFNF